MDGHRAHPLMSASMESILIAVGCREIAIWMVIVVSMLLSEIFTYPPLEIPAQYTLAILQLIRMLDWGSLVRSLSGDLTTMPLRMATGPIGMMAIHVVHRAILQRLKRVAGAT